MASFLIDEKSFINDNIFLHETRMGSQYSRFLDKTPTFVRYFNINGVESTVDIGFQNIERYLGPNSPLRFNEVKDLPIYGIDQIVLDLQEEENGLDTSYNGEGIILPNTIKPYPADFFTISYLDKNYLFIVTEVAYDTIKSNGFYRISFSIKSLEPENVEHLENQTVDKFVCEFSNIGTEDKALVRTADVELIKQLEFVFASIVNKFKIFYYDKKFNAFVFENTNRGYGYSDQYIYDRFLNKFINKHNIFNERNQYDTIYVTEERIDRHFEIAYHDSIYRALEVGKVTMGEQLYSVDPINDPTSIFRIYRKDNARDINLTLKRPNCGCDSEYYINRELLNIIPTGSYKDVDSVVWKIIIDYFNNDLTLHKLRLDDLEDFNVFMDYSLESYKLIPILLFILRKTYKKFMTNE